jgi:hypothetical protein
LKKRTSINSNPRIHKEKEMADFRKWLYALAMVALIVGLTIPANAQGGAVNCSASTVPTLIRAQAYADLVGDYTLTCTGGTSTPAGGVVPSVSIQVFLSTNITSKLTNGASSPFDEALLIVDNPNTATGPGGLSATTTPAGASIPILNCGQTGAPENTVSGPGVCQITSDGNPYDTYDGTAGHPNVFQGRTANLGVTGISSSIVFQGVPFDPPGTLPYRSLRITNIRADAEILGVASSFVQQTVTMSVSFSGVSGLVINNLTAQQNVATILNGLTVTSDGKGDTNFNNLAFLQCNSENPKLFAGTSSTGNNITNYPTSVQPGVQFVEGFASSWKAKNIATMLANGTVTVGGDVYGGTLNYPSDLAQNVPGYNYFTESGFEWAGGTTAQAAPVPNPPTASATLGAGGLPLYDASTGIQNAGIANQGTRLALSFTNIPQGVNIYVNPVVTLTNGTTITGVMVYTATDASGNGTFTAPTGATVAGASSTVTVNPTAGPPVGTNNLIQVSGGLAVYEVLFADPNSTEAADVPVVVAYASNLSSNPPIGLPVPGTATQVAGGFAPFYTTATARQPSATLPVPRFIPGATPLNIFEVVKCACDLLFPFTVSNSGFDTGLAIANTSLDPGANYGFGATPQQGTVTFFYFGTGAGGQVAPSSQTSGVVPAGQVLTYVLSSGGGAIGTTGANGLDGRAGTGQFEGYIIAQAGFQYCHGFAFISPLGGGPLSPGISEGYLGLELDKGGLFRTAQASENLAH